MPAQEISHRRQKALLWARTGEDQHGQPLVSPTSVPLQVRWNDKESEALDPKGNTIRVDATAVVAQDIAIGSILWEGGLVELGTLLGHAATTSSIPTTGLMQAVTFNKTLDVKGRVAARTIGMVRWSDSMPTQQV